MGAAESKSSGPPNQYVFSAQNPVQFSEGLVNSLQNSAETDSTRARNLELIIQQRVTSELDKRLKDSSQKLSSLAESISKEPSDDGDNNGGAKPMASRIADKLRGADQSSLDDEMAKRGIDREKVAKDIESLRKKLASRKQKVEVDKDLERAKENVIICLRKHDRRPLDCWQEVEHFKQEVAKLERSFVDKNAS